MSPTFIPHIRFEDQHLIVLSKPAGLLSQSDSGGDESLVDLLRDHVGRHYIGLVHRLDRNTSGLMVVAKRTKAARRLTKALQDGELTRRYQGWICGDLPEKIRWEHWLLKDAEKNQVFVHRNKVKDAKKACLWAVPLMHKIWKKNPVTLAEFTLETGRSHQIRAQASEEGFPLIGDLKYGSFTKESALASFGRPALHSVSLSFPHPMTNEILAFEDALPDDMASIQNS